MESVQRKLSFAIWILQINSQIWTLENGKTKDAYALKEEIAFPIGGIDACHCTHMSSRAPCLQAAHQAEWPLTEA